MAVFLSRPFTIPVVKYKWKKYIADVTSETIPSGSNILYGQFTDVESAYDHYSGKVEYTLGTTSSSVTLDSGLTSRPAITQTTSKDITVTSTTTDMNYSALLYLYQSNGTEYAQGYNPYFNGTVTNAKNVKFTLHLELIVGMTHTTISARLRANAAVGKPLSSPKTSYNDTALVGIVTSENINAYPDDGLASDGYWYQRV